MTTYTKASVGHITEVRPGLFTAVVDADSNGKLPMLQTNGEHSPVGQPGSYMAITQNGIRVLAMVTDMVENDIIKAADNLPGRRDTKQWVVNLTPLGEINSSGTFESGVKNYPVAGAELHPVTEDDIKSIFVKFRSQGYSVGELSSRSSLDVCLDPGTLFSRHSAILGQSGAGKSWTVTNLLQRAVKVMPNAHIILLDLHGEYSWKDQEGKQHYAFDEKVVRHIDARDLEMPYWLMTFAELVDLFIDRTDESASTQIAFLRDTVFDLRNKSNKDLGIGHLSVDSPVYFSLEELYEGFEEANKMTTNFGKEKGALAGQFDQFLMRLQSRMNDVRYDFMLSARCPSMYAQRSPHRSGVWPSSSTTGTRATRNSPSCWSAKRRMPISRVITTRVTRARASRCSASRARDVNTVSACPWSASVRTNYRRQYWPSAAPLSACA